MNFNAPVSLRDQPHFSEGSGMASVRDSRNNSQLWKKVRNASKDNFSHSQALQKVIREVSKMRRKPLGGFVPTPQIIPITVTPFTIYNQAGSGAVAMNELGTGYASGDLIKLSGGVVKPGSTATEIRVFSVGKNGTILQCGIATQGDYSTQPTFPNPVTTESGSGSGAVVTITSQADDWRTFCIRDGAVGWRPRNAQFLTNYTSLQPVNGIEFLNTQSIGTPQQVATGNSEFVLPVINDFGGFIYDQPTSNPQPDQAVFSGYNSIILKDSTDVQISGFDDDGNMVSFAQVLFSSNALINAGSSGPNSGTPIQASFWIEIIDDPVKGFYANTWGRMSAGGAGFATQEQNFPIGKSNVIPIGIVSTGIQSFIANPLPNGNFYFQQFLSADLTGRFYPGVQINAGRWNADSLSGKLFYPGDIVTDDTATSDYSGNTDPDGTNILAYGVYLMTGDVSLYGFLKTTTSPKNDTGDGGNWTLIGNVFSLT